MATSGKFVKLAGSQKKPYSAGNVVREVNSDERVEITLILRRPPEKGPLLHAASAMNVGQQRIRERSYLTHSQFNERHGSSSEDLAKVEAFAREHELTVVDVNSGARSIKLSGPLGKLVSLFPVDELHEYEGPTGRFRAHSGPVSIPTELAGIVTAVFGLDTRPAVRPRTISAAPKTTTFTVPQLAGLYNFPQHLDGSGQCIAIVAMNDASDGTATGGGFRQSDLQAYFGSMGLPVPRVTTVSVDGGANLPGPAPGYDSEITLDIEVAGASAAGARLVVYFAPNSDKGFIDCVNSALHDSVNKPSVISISWGAEEESDVQLARGLDEAFQDSAQLGVTICVATGDLGSADQIPPEMDGKPHVDSPSSSPFALACGGTKLKLDGNTILKETVWNDGVRNPLGTGAGGGGISSLFDRPSYQDGLTLPKSSAGTEGRGLPDVAGHAATSAGYQVVINGKTTAMGGTSAVTPLFAGLIARINEHLAASGKPHAGFINPLIYKAPASFRDITEGNNDLTGQLKVYHAGPGWDPCTGLGVPDGVKLLETLAS